MATHPAVTLGILTAAHPLTLSSGVTSWKHLLGSAGLGDVPFTVVCHCVLILWPFDEITVSFIGP